MQIAILKKEQDVLWKEYIEKNPETTFFHKIEWRDLVVDLFGFTPYYLIATDGNVFKGVLPLFLTPHGLFQKKMVSVPFAVAGGVCGDDRETEKALIKKAIELTKSKGADFLELRNFNHKPGNLTQSSPYFTFMLKLPDDSEIIWKSMHNEMRRCVRRSREYGITLDLDNKDIKGFYSIYAGAHRFLGTPPAGFKWIYEVFSRFPENHRIANAYIDGKVIATILVREYKDTIGAVFGHVIRDYRNMYPLYLLYWSLIEEGCKKGFKKFDFGRSIEESGTFKFKKRWGAEPHKLNYQYYKSNNKKVADTSQSGTARKKFAAVWKRLPLVIVNKLGPVIRGYYP
ncbi:FemAB family PEP-CTERM system-associated protein [bacterium]|nr:FemAB family PEP-CTERM system-associated protein [bacterium]